MAPPFALTALLTTHDPGAARLRKAARGASAMAIGALLVVAIRTVVDVPAAAELSAGFLSLWATVGAVKDATSRARIITTVALLIPGFAAALIACLLRDLTVARAVAFVAIAGLAAWSTRFGPRGSALSFFGFFVFFFAVVMKADLHALPVLCGLVVIAVATALFVRLVLIPDRPGRELESLIRGMRVCADDLLRVAVEAGHADAAEDRDRLAGAVTRLSAAASEIAGWQKDYDTALYADADAEALSRRVAMLHLSCEQAAFLVAERGGDRYVAAAVSLVREFLRSETRPPVLEQDEAFTDGDPTIATLGVVASATAELRAIEIHRRKKPATPPAPGPTPASRPPTGPPAAGESTARSNPGAESKPAAKPARPDTTRFALQVVVACSAALIVGDLISASRWYWAVLSAFMVFNGMATRGAILTKAVKRVQGTVVGLLVGVALVLLIGEHPNVQYVIVVCAVFFAFYLGSVSYTWTILFITIVLTNTYDLLGVLNRHVLEWRVEETLCGALVGSAAAFFVLSTPTSPVLAAKLHDYFDALVDLASVAFRRTGRPSPGAGGGAVPDSEAVPDSDAVLGAVRALDAAESAILGAATAAVFALSRSHRATLRRVRPHLRETTRAARGLAWSAVEAAGAGTAVPEHRRAGAPDPVEELRAAVDATVSALEHGEVDESRLREAATDREVATGGAPAELGIAPADPDPVRQAQRVTESVRRMAAAVPEPRRRARERRTPAAR